MFHNFRMYVGHSPLEVSWTHPRGEDNHDVRASPSYRHTRIGKASRGRCMPSTITPSSRPRTPWPAPDAPLRARGDAPASPPAPSDRSRSAPVYGSAVAVPEGDATDHRPRRQGPGDRTAYFHQRFMKIRPRQEGQERIHRRSPR